MANRPNGIPMREPATVNKIIMKAYRRAFGQAYYISAQQIHVACLVIWNSIN